MLIKLIILIAIIIILSGGIVYYYKITKKLAKEFKEFMQITFNSLKDKKLTIAEKEQILKEFADMKPYARKLKNKFIDDAKELLDDIKDAYENLKNKIKK